MLMWVGTVTCCTNPVVSRSSRNLMASGSSGTSIWMLKSPEITRWSVQWTAESRNCANSVNKTLVMTGCVSEYGGPYTIIKCMRCVPDVTFHSEYSKDSSSAASPFDTRRFSWNKTPVPPPHLPERG